MRLSLALSCSVVTTGALVLAMLPGAATAADAADLSVDEVGVLTYGGGYPSLSWGFMGLQAGFSDASPAGQHDYVVSAVPEDGGDPVTGTFQAYQGWDGTEGWAELIGTDEDFEVGHTYLVSVTEYDGTEPVAQSAEVPFTLTVMDHPVSAKVRKQEVAGRKNTVRAGSVVRIRWRGEWEQGTQLTQVVFAPPRRGEYDGDDFLVCEGSYCPTKRGVRVVAGGVEPVNRFRVPRRYAGRTLTVVSYGTLRRGEVTTERQWGWEWTFRVRKG